MTSIASFWTAEAACHFGHDDGELVAAEPGEKVTVFQLSRDQMRDFPEQLVSGGVAERTFDLLEAVEIEQQQPRGRPVRPQRVSTSSISRRNSARLARPVRGSWYASFSSCPSALLRSEMSWIVPMKPMVSPWSFLHQLRHDEMQIAPSPRLNLMSTPGACGCGAPRPVIPERGRTVADIG